MRLRNVKGSRETIAANDYVVHNETGMKGHWHELFDNDNPIHIEIGMGKGQFIMELARRNPDINYIGIEKYSSVLVRALEKRELEPEMTNLYFIRMDAEYITDVFDTNEVDRIYLNFSAYRPLLSPSIYHVHHYCYFTTIFNKMIWIIVFYIYKIILNPSMRAILFTFL